MPIQIRRTKSSQEPTGLLEGQLSVNLTVPPRLWVGAPDLPDGRLLIVGGDYVSQRQVDDAIDVLRAEVASQYVRIAGAGTRVAPPTGRADLPATQQYVDNAIQALREEIAEQYVRIA